MKICVYGISCSGKDTLISELLQNPDMKNFRHYKGSWQLNKIAEKRFCRNLKLLNESEKEIVRKQFMESLQDEDNFLVDGHFCFPSLTEKKFQTVFTDSDLALYDSFVYLKSNAKEIYKRIQDSEKNKRFASLSVEELHEWQCFEINWLREKCFYAQKDFIIIDDDLKNAVAYLSRYANNTRFNSIEIARHIVDSIVRSESKKIALIDCDRTSTAEDTTIPFFELNGGKLTALKTIFADDSYSHYQFWKQAKLYKDFSKYPNIADFHLNFIVCDKISSFKKQGYIVYGLTSGVFEIWKQINEKHQLFESIIGNDLSDSGFIISDFVKGFVSKLLKQKGYSVVSIGDSMCDIFMLEEADKGYIYAPNKLRPHVQKYIDEHSKTKIVQFARNPHQYAGIISEE